MGAIEGIGSWKEEVLKKPRWRTEGKKREGSVEGRKGGRGGSRRSQDGERKGRSGKGASKVGREVEEGLEEAKMENGREEAGRERRR